MVEQKGAAYLRRACRPFDDACQIELIVAILTPPVASGGGPGALLEARDRKSSWQEVLRRVWRAARVAFVRNTVPIIQQGDASAMSAAPRWEPRQRHPR